MDTKEFQYNDVVINGFVALFINLAILPPFGCDEFSPF